MESVCRRRELPRAIKQMEMWQDVVVRALTHNQDGFCRKYLALRT